MTVRLDRDTITPSIARIRAALDLLPDRAYKEWVKQTPIQSGNARRKTRLVKTAQGGIIDAAYPYAQRLDEGYSTQAPRGMSEPVQKFIEREIKRIMRL